MGALDADAPNDCKNKNELESTYSNQSCHYSKTLEMIFACKKCKKVFRKDMTCVSKLSYSLYIHRSDMSFQCRNYEESDEYCPHCDNHYIIDAKTPQMGIGIEGDDPRLVKDYRSKVTQFNEPDLMADRLG